jgi:hypothetical protein
MLCTSLILQIPVSSLDRRDGSGVPRQHCLTIEKQTTDDWPTTLYPAALISQWSPLHGLVSLLAQPFFFLFYSCLALTHGLRLFPIATSILFAASLSPFNHSAVMAITMWVEL